MMVDILEDAELTVFVNGEKAPLKLFQMTVKHDNDDCYTVYSFDDEENDE